MHVLAIYSVNQHMADLMAGGASRPGWRADEAKAAKPKARRFAFPTSRFAGRGSTVAVAGPTKALASS